MRTCLSWILAIEIVFGWVQAVPTVASAASSGEWTVNHAYALGDTVTYQSSTYECTFAHTSLQGWEPPAVPALWKKSAGTPGPLPVPGLKPLPAPLPAAVVYPVELSKGGTVDGGDGWSPDHENKEMAFDDNLFTKWLVYANSGWLQYQFPANQQQTVSSYSITSANDEPVRDPKSWTLKGSNNGTDWTVLDQRQNQVFSDRFQTLTYPIAAPQAYTYYKLELTASSGDMLQLAEIGLYNGASVTYTPPAAPAVTVSAEKSADAGKANLLDGASLTKWATGAQSGWAKLSYSQSVSIDGYALTGTNGGVLEPASWTLKGSDDGTTWTVLDSRTNQTFAIAHQRKSYQISAASYRYYQFDFTSRAANGLEVGEIELTRMDTPSYSDVPELEIRNTDTVKGQLFTNSLPDAENEIRAIIRKVNTLLYDHPSQRKFGARKLVIRIEDFDGIAYATGDQTEGQIVFSMRYLDGDGNGDARDEIIGILYHEIAHPYQQDDHRYGEINYIVEGMADAVRFKVGYHNRYGVSKGGSWMDSYQTTGSFFLWIDEYKHAGFLKKLNQSLSPFDGVDWTPDAIRTITGTPVDTLWAEFQSTLK
ncbi:basic secretory protein-like protein [Paenibacillus sp. FJAT-26967]|uniref:basic secretory protein-like protein n=1 Tax=Paenibacillus sp. FJAT-26967 TaxID=1729690 RepID=UPI00083866CF|nr:basic secretory protein-like protein [Paenibacillus sp. FJAT-26967]